MNPYLAYILGVLTPPALIATPTLIQWAFAIRDDSRDSRRYNRAWAKFGQEFDNLTNDQLIALRRHWTLEGSYMEHQSSDRDRYFLMKWRHGNTTEI